MTSALSVSTTGHSVYAKYSGDLNFVVNTSNTVTQVVNKASTSVAVSSSLPSSTLNQAVTFKATISVVAPGAGTPTGTVTFYLDSASGTLLASAAVSSATASISTSAVPVNQHTIYAVYSGDGSFTGSTGTVMQMVQYASSGMCDGEAGHQILQPINVDGSSVWKQGSTVPAKFRVCDVNGNSIGTSGVITGFALYKTSAGTMTAVDETADNSTNDLGWRFDSTAQQWIFNMSTKTAPQNVANRTYFYQITINDGSTILFDFGLK
jgi:hypothetical protein